MGDTHTAPSHAGGRWQETALWLSPVVWTVTLALTIFGVPRAAAQPSGKVLAFSITEDVGT